IFFYLLFIFLLPPRFTLFPYTTLFRSLRYARNYPISSRLRLLTPYVVNKPQSHLITCRRARLPLLRALAPHDLRQWAIMAISIRSEEHTSELQSRENLVCRLLLEKKTF